MLRLVTELEFLVPPLVGTTLPRRAAAHFLDSFASNSNHHIRDVLKHGLRGVGGMLEEVAYWHQNCSEDVEGQNALRRSNGWWDVEEMGPWIFETIAVENIALAVSDHTRGWKTAEFASYGQTTEDQADFHKLIEAV